MFCLAVSFKRPINTVFITVISFHTDAPFSFKV